MKFISFSLFMILVLPFSFLHSFRLFANNFRQYALLRLPSLKCDATTDVNVDVSTKSAHPFNSSDSQSPIENDYAFTSHDRKEAEQSQSSKQNDEQSVNSNPRGIEASEKSSDDKLASSSLSELDALLSSLSDMDFAFSDFSFDEIESSSPLESQLVQEVSNLPDITEMSSEVNKAINSQGYESSNAELKANFDIVDDASAAVSLKLSDDVFENTWNSLTSSSVEEVSPTPKVWSPNAKKIYKPRADNTAPIKNVYSPRKSVSAESKAQPQTLLVLKHPHSLNQFIFPKEKSEFKKQLEKLQDVYNDNSDSTPSKSTSSKKDSFLASLAAPSPSVDPFGKKVKGKKDARRYDEDEVAEKKKSKKSSNADDDDEYDFDDMLTNSDEDYYGDNSVTSFYNIPGSALLEMDNEGFSVEEMQMAVYAEYGIKASESQIRNRLQKEKSGKGNKKSGKTKRDKAKARQAKYNVKKVEKIKLPEGSIQVQELANLMDVGSGEVVRHLMMNMGIMATMNQNIDISTAKEIVLAFGKELQAEEEDVDEVSDDENEGDEVIIDGQVIPNLPRPPVVTIMGHVDHGKTTLLDSIRKTQVALGEAGGITQGISAFNVKTAEGQAVTFIDTPGHAAFSEMRKRGANMTDIVILVVAADDGVMEQTKECIYAAKAANCPIVVAVNKIDKEGADADQVLNGLMSYDVLVEDFGGDVQVARISAKKGIGLDDLLAKVLLQAEIMNLKAPVDTKAEGIVIEARVDRGLGTVATLLVQKGTLRVGDVILAGPSWGKVRRIISDQGEDLKEAGPSTPVQVIGLSSIPSAGDTVTVTDSEAAAREVAEARQRLDRQSVGIASSATIASQATGLLDGSYDNREVIKVPIVIKADVSGSVEALISSINALELSDDTAICKPDIVFAGVGEVTTSDIALANVAKAKTYAFNVGANYQAMEEARANNIDIGYYNVVYDLLDELEAIIKNTLAPPPPGKLIGQAEIQKLFRIGKVGKIAGCKVTDGLIKMDSMVRVMRGKRNPIFVGKLSSLRVVKDVVQEVPEGSDCGLSVEDFQDFEEGDVIECFVGENADLNSDNY